VQIIIPMSGFGERFRRAGYDQPKPLIMIDGKPIIAHVLDMFPDEADVIFICNRDHLAEPSYQMADVLRRLRPTAKIVPIGPHKLGPVNAVLQAREHIDLMKPVVVNYCDFTCYWDYQDFKTFVAETKCDGCVPAYRGFHPHSLGSTFYAYVKETGLWMDDIQEKQPWTDNPMSEFASSGTYYFRSGQLCIEALEEQMRQDLNVNGEFYVSLSYRILKQRKLKTAVYELQHFMQWGTPADLEEYCGWSNTFRRLAVDDALRPRQRGAVVIPMAGLGKRFSEAGYKQVKPLIPVSGRAMVIQATRDLPDAPVTRFVLREDIDGVDAIQKKLRTSFVGAEIKMLEALTEGQAITCKIGSQDLNPDDPVTFGACDNGMLYDARKLEEIVAEGPDVLVWVVRGHADGRMRPKMFGWVDEISPGVVSGVRVKAEPDDPATAGMIVGVFTFRHTRNFLRCVDSLVARDGRVNGEFYVDSLLKDAIDMGLKVRVFEIDHYIGWGTPNDLRTYEYWQSCFHKWKSHVYRLEKDRRIPTSMVPELDNQFRKLTPNRPAGVRGLGSASTQEGPTKSTTGESLRFIAIGLGAVGIDFLVYQLLTQSNMDPNIAKALSFMVGGVWAFLGNRFFTFRKKSGALGFTLFWLIYLTTLVANVAANQAVLTMLGDFQWARVAAFGVATLVSATLNFIGMKLAVFRGPRMAS
jgi:NDP-sugar pyrophosphorylase family protein/putative flippase GtrA